MRSSLMKNRSIAYPTQDILFLAVVLAISVGFFIFYLKQNVPVLAGDEYRYYFYADSILKNGFVKSGSDNTTYFYPLVIMLVQWLVNRLAEAGIGTSLGQIALLKLGISIIQYFVYLATVIFAGKVTWKVTGKKFAYYAALLAGALNPYMIQACTLLLTDILSTCFVCIAILFALSSDLNRLRNLTLTFSLAFISVMVRPSALIFVPIVIVIFAIRLLKREFRLSAAKILVMAALLGIFAPQLYSNVANFQHWTPLLHQNLLRAQNTWAVCSLKYVTVIPPAKPVGGLNYINPYCQNGNVRTIYELLVQDFLQFSFVAAAHIFAVLDWGYVDTYIRNFYTPSRILGSIGIYTSWYLVFYGIWIWLKSTPWKMKLAKPEWFPCDFVFGGLLTAASVYIAFIVTTTPEARFGYPIFMLLLPFLGFGFSNLAERCAALTGRATLFFIRGHGSLLVMVVLIGFVLSFWFDTTTQQINWGRKILNRLDGVVEVFNP